MRKAAFAGSIAVLAVVWGPWSGAVPQFKVAATLFMILLAILGKITNKEEEHI